MAKSIASPAALVPLVATALVYRAMSESCTRLFGGSMILAPGGQWEECRFTTGPSTMYFFQSGSVVGPKMSTPLAACTAGYPLLVAAYPHLSGHTEFYVNDSSMCYAPGQYLGSIASTTENTIQQDPNNPWKPATPARVEQLMKERLSTWPTADTEQLLENMIDLGLEVEPSNITLTGPSSTTGTPTTETITNPDGSTTTRNTRTDYDYRYVQNTIYQTDVLATPRTVTSAENEPLPEPTPEPEDTPDPCLENPGRLGCIDSGEPPDPDEIPRQDVPVTYSPISFSAPASCPANIGFDIFGTQYAISWTPFCDMLVPIRLIFLAFGAALAAVIFMDGLKA